MYIHRSCLLSFFLFTGFTSFSQKQNFSIYSIDEGIPQSQVHCITQDKRGFLWFGTDGGGLTRFDGKKFHLYTTANGLCNDLVYAMATDTGGSIWLATAKGVALLEGNKLIPIPNSLKILDERMIRSVATDGKGRVAFGTQNGLYVYSAGTLLAVEELDGKTITAVSFLKDGRIASGAANEGMFLIDSKGKLIHFTSSNGLPHNTIHSFLEQKSGVLVGTERGVVLFSDGKFHPKIVLPSVDGSKEIVRELVQSVNGGYWIVTLDCGTFLKTNDTCFQFGKSEGLGVDGAFCVFEDHEKNVWIGTDGNGAAKLGKQTFTSLGNEQGLPSEMILSICKTSKGHWWYGNQEGATWFNGKEYKHFGNKEGLSDEKVWSVIEDDKGNIWIATYGSGVFKFDGRTFQNFNEKTGLSSNNVRAIFQDSKKRIWIATANGLNIKEGNTFRIFRKNNGLGTDRFLRVYEDRSRRIWIGTSGNGLALLKQEKDSFDFDIFNSAIGLADDVVLSITEDQEGRIWTGNFGGISCVYPEKKTVKKITRSDGLISNTVYAIEFINDSMLLVGTNNGIDKINIRKFEKEGKVSPEHYGKEEGFRGVECNTSSVWKDSDGSIWFGTIKGVFRYDPLKDRQNRTPPILVLNSIRLFFEQEDLSPYAPEGMKDDLPVSPVFPHNKNHLTFDFVGMSFTIPSNVRYTYRIEGFDKNWSVPGMESFATYSNLPHGKYTFHLKASNSDGVWSDKLLSFSFEITPPFWKTWWFYTLCISGIILGVYLFVQYRLKRMKAIQEYLENQVQLKTKELREEKEVVEQQSLLIEKKNKAITSSIRYAKRIQDSILPLSEKLNEHLHQSFIFFRPKDIVSGDFYWFRRVNGCTLVAAVDCTGHGVPGAFMSLIGNNLLNHITGDLKVSDPKIILEKLHEGVVQTLKKNELESGTVDGMDITLVVIHHESKKLEYASTGRPLFLFSKGELQKIKVGKHPVGLVAKKEIQFEKGEKQLWDGDTFYLFTDGYCDQFGGKEEDKYLESHFGEFLKSIQKQSMPDQLKSLENEHLNWKGEIPQIDDILVIGIRL